MLYFAFGSNLNLRQMARRCPAAIPLQRFQLGDSRLVFRGVADCVYEPGSKCIGGLWRITPACLRALDAYEGIGSGMYRKEYTEVGRGKYAGEQVMFYCMNSTGIFPPSTGYLAGIREGYRDFKIPVKHLEAAVRDSWDEKAPSHIERQRYRRTGRPTLSRVVAK